MVRNKKVKLLLLFLLAFILGVFSLGHTIEPEFLPSHEAGWLLHPDNHNYHMGSEDTTYSYFDETAESYNTHVDAGKTMWGSNISMSEVESGGIGVIKTADWPSDPSTAECPPECHNPDPDNHYHDYHETGWEIIINIPRFDAEYRTDEHKKRTLAHEIGHVYGLADLENEGNKSQIMYHEESSIKNVTFKDIWGIRICTDTHTEHNFNIYICEDSNYCVKACSYCLGYIEKFPHQFTSSQVIIGTQNTCRKTVRTCDLCGYSYVSYWDKTHTWTDKYDATCNDCGYTKTVAVTEVEGLLTATIDGQSWVLNSSETGTELQYSSSYTLPNGGTLTWNNVGDGAPYNRYCYNYNGIDYIYGDQYLSYMTRFSNLREMTKVYDDENSYYYLLRYILDRPDGRYKYQWVQTTKTLQGGFYAQLLGNEVNGYYVVIYRVLVDGTGNKYHYAEVWSPSRQILVYFSP